MALVDYESDDEGGGDPASFAAPSPTSNALRVASGGPLKWCTCRTPSDFKFLPVQGDWPCLVFIEVPPDAVAQCGHAAYVATLLGIQLEALTSDAPDVGIHVSLSRPFTLRHEQIAPFVDALRGQLRSGACSPRRLELASPAVFVNDNGGRSFAAALVGEGRLSVLALLTAVDACLRAYGKPAYYVPPTPHASLAVARGDAQAAAEAAGLCVHRAEEGQQDGGASRTAVDALLMSGTPLAGAFAQPAPGSTCPHCGGTAGVGSVPVPVALPYPPPTAPAHVSFTPSRVVLRAGHLTFAFPMRGEGE